VAGLHQFTHAAELHAKVVIGNFFKPVKQKLDASHMAWVTYTTPEVATFGQSEQVLKKEGTMYEVLTQDLSEDDRALIDGDQGFLRLCVDRKGTILGGTLIARHAGEIIGELILAEHKELTLKDLFDRIAPYPTASRIIRRIGGAYLSRSLTSRSKKLLRMLYSLFS
jgi:pyruvate/2-oxoglutarate dehydrogenase complex dihydrolipoamide dehydrogenase (E3) component